MKKLTKIFSAIFMILGFISFYIGCKGETITETVYVDKIIEVEKPVYIDTSEPKDNTSPNIVSNLLAFNKDASVLLTWTDASDEDIFGYEVTYTKNNFSRNISPMREGSIFVAPKSNGCFISNLTNNVSYTFFVKSMDTSGNYSKSTASITCIPQVIEKKPLTLMLDSNNKELTNSDVQIKVNVSTDEKSYIKKIVFYEGIIFSAQELLEKEGAISFYGDTISVSNNGTYSVAAVDSEGRKEISYITITNIDKISPSPISNLSYSYDASEKTILLTWENPKDDDMKNIILTYNSNYENKELELSKDSNFFELKNINSTAEKYDISLYVKDIAGNISERKNISAYVTESPIITKLELSCYHIDNTTTNRSIDVNIFGLNFDKIEEQEDTSFIIRVVQEGETNGTSFIVNEIDIENNIAKATIQAPKVTNPTTEGTNINVFAILCGLRFSTQNATLIVSSAAYINNIFVDFDKIAKKDVTENMKAKISVTGTNLDAINGNIEIALYDSKNNEYTSSRTIVQKPTLLRATTFEAEVPIPKQDDKYTVKILYDSVVKNATTIIHVYEAKFSTFKIPRAGLSKSYNTIKANITGKDFSCYESEDFIAICDLNSIVKETEFIILSDEIMTVTFTIPVKAGNYSIWIQNGENKINGEFEVLDYTDWTIGDILYTDGTRSSVNDIDSTKTVESVFTGFNVNGSPLGINLRNSQNTWFWSTALVDLPEIGVDDFDGSDNWEYICQKDSFHISSYKAFKYAESYGENWFIPSKWEFEMIIENVEKINESLSVCNGDLIKSFDSSYTSREYHNCFWTSTQINSTSAYIWKADRISAEKKNTSSDIVVSGSGYAFEYDFKVRLVKIY